MTPFEIHPIDDALIEPAFDLVTEVFATSSSLHAALSVDLETYRHALRPDFDDMVAQNLSCAAIDEGGHLLGCLIATDLLDTLASEPSGPYPEIGALTQTLTQRYYAYRPFQKGEVVLVDMAAVRPEAQGVGAYRALRTYVEAQARAAGWRHIVGELSSTATQRLILNKMGHRKVVEISFQDFECNGACPFQKITSPPSIILAEGTL